MCGLAGWFDRKGGIEEREGALLRQMTDVIAHRGPDDEGFYQDRHAALGFRRLAIIDLAGSHQPLSNEDGTVWIVFNGEIYNYPELREWLLGRGHRFRTNGDTETIVHLYEEVGAACPERLRGMFALAIWDQRKRELFLARDRVGKKPLYYVDDGRRIWFGSEIKSILQDERVPADLDPQALESFLTFTYVPAPMTGFKHIRKLPGGHWLKATVKGREEREYWDWTFRMSNVECRMSNTATSKPNIRHSPFAIRHSERDYASILRSHLEHAVRIRLMSEVPLGAFLSGGVDSSVVVALMARELQEPVRTTSIGFDYEKYNELQYAEAVARQFGTQHSAQVVKPDAVEILEKIVWHCDEPFADPSALPTYYLSQTTREYVTVALSGDGGDEVFAGYEFRYLPTQKEMALRRWIPGAPGRSLLGALAAVYPHSSRLPRALRLKSIFGNLAATPEQAHARDLTFLHTGVRNELRSPEFVSSLGGFRAEDLVLDLFRKTTATHWLDRALYVDARFYMQNDVLTKVDRMSMANSLEVRSPFLDHEVMEFMATVPADLKLRGNRCKHLLKESMADCLAPSLLDRPKQGFSIPLDEWLRAELRDYWADWVLRPEAFVRNYLRPPAVRSLWDKHQRGENYGIELWTLLMLELWGSTYLENVRAFAPRSSRAMTNVEWRMTNDE